MSAIVPAATPNTYYTIEQLLIVICQLVILKFPMATQLQPSSSDTIQPLLFKIAYNLSLIPSTGGSGNYSGAGSPEGVQIATPGSYYWDTVGHHIYAKDTGTGSTGWLLVV